MARIRLKLPRGNNARIHSQDERSDLQRLFMEYGDVPLYCLTLLHKSRNNKMLDCLEMKVEGGMVEYLKCMLGKMIDITSEEATGDFYVSASDSVLHSDNDDKENIGAIHIVRKQNFERACAPFFNANSVLWKGREDLLDRRKNLIIATSPIEQSRSKNPEKVDKQINEIRLVLRSFPNGLPLSRLVNYVYIDLKLLDATDVNSLTVKAPEIFYRHERDQQEPLIFDGRFHTYPDLSGKIGLLYGEHAPEKIVEETMWNGVYQRTLILMRDKGLHGLKINTWICSMQKSFYKDGDKIEELHRYSPLIYFMALARCGLVEIISGKDSKNDLKARVPRDKLINFEHKFKFYCKHRSNSLT